MNDLHDLIENQLSENRTNSVHKAFSEFEPFSKEIIDNETNCLGISVAITSLEKVREVKESHYIPDGLRKVILWEDGKEYEIIIKPK